MVLAILLATAPAAAPAIVVVIVIVPHLSPITSDLEDEILTSANNATTTSSFTSGTTNDDGSTASGTSGDDVDDSAAADPTDPTGPTAYDDADHTYHFTLLLRDGSTRTLSIFLPALAFRGRVLDAKREPGPARARQGLTNYNIAHQHNKQSCHVKTGFHRSLYYIPKMHRPPVIGTLIQSRSDMRFFLPESSDRVLISNPYAEPRGVTQGGEKK